MSELPSTLELMQRDILQYDLSNNPYLQGSVIPSKDKELKTNAKMIIPAINELLKIINSFTGGMQTFMEEVKNKINNIDNAIVDLNKKINLIDNSNTDLSEIIKNYNSCSKDIEELKLDISIMKKVCKCYNDNEDNGEDIMKFNSKIKLTANEAKEIPLKATSLANFQDQIVIYAYDEGTQKYKLVNMEFKMQTASNTIYKFSTSPVEIRVDYETDELTLVNNCRYEVVIYLFE